ncbi:MAG: YceI family protein [Microthrixaceae bacterium]
MNLKSWKPIAVIAALLLVLAGAGVWWFLGGDPVDEVSLDAATGSVETTAADTTDGAGSDSADTTADTDLSGVWNVDTTTGEFDYESATGSFVGFRIEEELAGIGSTTAVGRTGDIEGSITVDGTSVTEASFDIDVTTITTEESRRDDNVQDALETGEFPSATFELTEPIELTDEALAGDAFAAPAVGDLTIHGTTQPIEMDLEAQLVDGTIVIVGSTDITFSDYGVEVPESQIVVSVEDFGTLELQLLLVR